MKNNKEYIAPLIDIIIPDNPSLMAGSPPSIESGGPGGPGVGDAKRHFTQFDDDIDELDDSSDSSEWCYVDYSNITFN